MYVFCGIEKNKMNNQLMIPLALIPLVFLGLFGNPFIEEKVLLKNLIFILPISAIIFIKRSYIKSFYKTKNIYIIFYLLVCISSCYIYNSPYTFLGNFLYLVSYMISIILIYYVTSVSGKDKLIIPLITIIILYILLYCYQYYDIIYSTFKSSNSLYGIVPEKSDIILSRSSGLARILVILIFFVYFNLHQKILKICALISLLIIEFLLMSRSLIALGLLSFIISNYFFYKHDKKKYKIIIIFLLAILSSGILIYLRPESLSNILTLNNRTRYWYDVLVDNSMNIFGLGIQADRVLINESLSNGYIYSYLSSGFLGLYFFIKYLIASISDLDLNSKYSKFAITTMIFIMMRMLIENGIAIYSLDGLIFIICANYVAKKINH